MTRSLTRELEQLEFVAPSDQQRLKVLNQTHVVLGEYVGFHTISVSCREEHLASGLQEFCNLDPFE